MIYHCGDNIMWDPPVLIPNTEVKPHRADGTVRDTVWESRTLPHFIKDIAGLKVMQCPLTYVSGAACVFICAPLLWLGRRIAAYLSGYALGRRAAPVRGTPHSTSLTGYALGHILRLTLTLVRRR